MSNDGWFQITSPDELSIGDHYYYCDRDDKSTVVLAEFHGDGFTCEAETLDFDDDFAYEDFWFKYHEWPKHHLAD
jgi:hypothetical protein